MAKNNNCSMFVCCGGETSRRKIEHVDGWRGGGREVRLEGEMGSCADQEEVVLTCEENADSCGRWALETRCRWPRGPSILLCDAKQAGAQFPVSRAVTYRRRSASAPCDWVP